MSVSIFSRRSPNISSHRDRSLTRAQNSASAFNAPGAVAGVERGGAPRRRRAGAGAAPAAETLNGALRLATVTSPAPEPLQAVSFLDPAMMGTCRGSRCFALRFRASGEVRGELPAGGNAGRPGFGFVVASNVDEGGAASRRRAIVVGFPTGVVMSYAP